MNEENDDGKLHRHCASLRILWYPERSEVCHVMLVVPVILDHGVILAIVAIVLAVVLIVVVAFFIEEA